ncbi:unnamed protein product [Sphenostylis stenocarpa]|uniref:Uncharacterized protein n=1 Tax=Sphenostylis stenocarpa TaxID=92480 RepID=A0AA86VJF0_9FABA|nr:unnamed protein product [Sphenostylis stenocarpa]
MAFLRSTFATSMLLLTVLVVVSATDYYGYGSAPDVQKPDLKTDYNPTKSDDLGVSKPKTDYYDNGYGPAPKAKVPKPKTDYKVDAPQLTKPDYSDNGYASAPKVEIPKPTTVYKVDAPQPTKPDYSDNGYGPAPKVEIPKPKTDYKVDTPQPTKPDYYEVPATIGVQGVVLCKSGSNYTPIQGAVTRITCGCEDELGGYETGSISVLSHATDSKGYFYSTISLSELVSNLKVTECKAYLESSPLETCKVPTDVNYGTSGAPLSSYRLLENKTQLYTVGPFFYTSQPATSQPATPLPNNGY